ncbi:MAG TPA: cytochrome c oxidase subunit 4 [Acidimicrobiia bacterium]|nr:cytochrome c oxidase subunit 4 [Acidimicrobiia bacterium]
MMQNEARVFLGVTVFFVVIGLVYWFTSYEDAGSVMLAACAGMGIVAGGAILFLSRNAPPRAEDDPNATVDEGAGVVDVFPKHSIWPFAVGLSATVMASGFAFGPWLVAIGGGSFAVTTTCWILEARRGHVPVAPAHDDGDSSSSSSSTPGSSTPGSSTPGSTST